MNMLKSGSEFLKDRFSLKRFLHQVIGEYLSKQHSDSTCTSHMTPNETLKKNIKEENKSIRVAEDRNIEYNMRKLV